MWKISFQFRGMNVPGDTLTAWGRVVKKEERGPYGLVDLVGLKNQKGDEGTPGTATVVVPSLEVSRAATTRIVPVTDIVLL